MADGFALVAGPTGQSGFTIIVACVFSNVLASIFSNVLFWTPGVVDSARVVWGQLFFDISVQGLAAQTQRKEKQNGGDGDGIVWTKSHLPWSHRMLSI